MYPILVLKKYNGIFVLPQKDVATVFQGTKSLEYRHLAGYPNYISVIMIDRPRILENRVNGAITDLTSYTIFY